MRFQKVKDFHQDTFQMQIYLLLRLQSHPQLALNRCHYLHSVMCICDNAHKDYIGASAFFQKGKTGCFSMVSKVIRHLSQKYIHSCIAWQSFDQWLLSHGLFWKQPLVNTRILLSDSMQKAEIFWEAVGLGQRYMNRETKHLVQSSPGVGMVGCKSATFYDCGVIDILANLLCGRTSGS